MIKITIQSDEGPASGKTTTAHIIAQRLHEFGATVRIFDNKQQVPVHNRLRRISSDAYIDGTQIEIHVENKTARKRKR